MDKKFLSTLCIGAALLVAACGSENKPSIIGQYCAVDSLDGSQKKSNVIVIGNSKKTKINGWIADVVANKSPEKVMIMLINSNGELVYTSQGDVDVKRPDLESVFKKDNILNSGYAITMDLSNIEIGVYQLQLLGVYKSQNLVCNPNISIMIQ